MRKVLRALGAGAASYGVTVVAGTAAGIDPVLVMMGAMWAGVAWTEFLL